MPLDVPLRDHDSNRRLNRDRTQGRLHDLIDLIEITFTATVHIKGASNTKMWWAVEVINFPRETMSCSSGGQCELKNLGYDALLSNSYALSVQTIVNHT